MPHETVIEKQTRSRARCCAQKFLAADIGISGANFLVADSGAVVIVENEGNARLTTTAPKIHIAIAGIEKVIPRAQDLAVFLKLLARSATGQLLTVYTSFLAGPRRAGRNRRPRRVLRGAAGQRPHAAAAGPGEAAVALLHPLRRVPEHLPGVPQDRRAQLSVGVLGADRRHPHAAVHGRRSTSRRCRSLPACAARAREVCPVKIDIPKVLLELRAEVKKAEGRDGVNRLERLAFRVFAWLMTHPRIYEMAGAWWRGLAPLGDGKWFRRAAALMNLPPVRAWLSQRDLPPAPAKSFRELWRQR